MSGVGARSIWTSRWMIIGGYVLATFVFSAAMLALQPVSGIDAAALSIVQFAPALGALVAWALWRRAAADRRPGAVPRRQVVAHTGLMVAACVLFALVAAGGALFAGRQLVGAAPAAGVP
ncbi:MAG TPA: hypothetical protein VE172_17085, partial [Stackebrandtia sp.]|nr:hypothetical protein [Stackebrandtia sp.]